MLISCYFMSGKGLCDALDIEDHGLESNRRP